MRPAVIIFAFSALLLAGPALADRRDDSGNIMYFWENAAAPGAGFGWSDQPHPSIFGSVRPRNRLQACELAVGRTMRRDNSGLTQSMLMVDACLRRSGG